ncbi:hypothetical protein DFH09DRAFT_1152111 [Mycena vulgaris]|nr:hypothetical protein DFH09DRAFT_1152111 [Mycena vulgaris]
MPGAIRAREIHPPAMTRVLLCLRALLLATAHFLLLLLRLRILPPVTAQRIRLRSGGGRRRRQRTKLMRTKSPL